MNYCEVEKIGRKHSFKRKIIYSQTEKVKALERWETEKFSVNKYVKLNYNRR